MAAAFFGAGLSLSESEEESFLAAAFLAGAAFLAAGFSLESESSEDDSATLAFLTGTAVFSATFLDLFFWEEAALALDSALALLVATTLAAGFLSESELSESSEDESFLAGAFLAGATFLLSAFSSLFLVLSIETFLDGASLDDEDEDDATCFCKKNES